LWGLPAVLLVLVVGILIARRRAGAGAGDDKALDPLPIDGWEDRPS